GEQAGIEGERPERGIVDEHEQRNRQAGAEQHDRARRRPDHRGAAVWSRISPSTLSLVSPSISALAAMTRRWRSAGRARGLTPSGMTKARTFSAASARTAEARALAARVEAPVSIEGCWRVERITSTI